MYKEVKLYIVLDEIAQLWGSDRCRILSSPEGVHLVDDRMIVPPAKTGTIRERAHRRERRFHRGRHV